MSNPRCIMLIVIVYLLTFPGCKKAADTGGGNSWTLGANTYTVNLCSADTSNPPRLFGENTTQISQQGIANQITVSFDNSLPAVSGTFSLINGNNTNPGTGQALVVATIGPIGTGTSYTSSGGGTISVTVTNGKMSISGTSIPMELVPNGGGATTLSLNIQQTQ